jgi:phospholipase C
LRSSFFKRNFSAFGRFAEDAGKGDLPTYSFIEPQYFDFFNSPANDQHPPHDVGLGEMLIADVYEALRASPAWVNTLLVVLYDEHGGIYDHEFPPAAVPPAPPAPGGFAFDRLGVRVPALLVSPWVARGKVVSTPFDHTSVLKTLREMFRLGSQLTDRDGAAATFETVLDESQPRTNTPATLPRPGHLLAAATRPSLMTSHALVAAAASAPPSTKPLSEFQESLVDLARELETGEPPTVRALTKVRVVEHEHAGAQFVREQVERFLHSR